MANAVKPVVLLVLDGFGTSLQERGNAVHAAKKPNLDYLEKYFPFTTLQASAVAVGLPWGEAGNSEVGHLTMGTGRVIYHHLPRIIVAIHDGSFYANPAFVNIVNHVRQNSSSLHLLGLVSSGSVHSYVDHLYALLELVNRENLPQAYLHVITDGKDAPPKEGADFVAQLKTRIANKHPTSAIASVIGRFYAMDRDRKWSRVQQAYETLIGGKGNAFQDAVEYINKSYERGVHDEFIEPGYLEKDGAPVGRIKAGDALIIFNFREDSVREITEAFVEESFTPFKREKLANLKIATMTEYEKNLAGVEAAFTPLEINWPLARTLSANGKNQLHIAESEKYAHVTYFFNGGVERPFPHEDRLLLPSLSVPHFDEHPEMRAQDIVAKIIERVDQYDFILGNLANADMVGHTGNFQATVRAVEIIDECIGHLVSEIIKRDGAMLLVGDHGNAEQKIHPISGEPMTEHTTNPVPFFLIGRNYQLKRERIPEEIRALKKATGGILIDVAPTVLDLMKVPKPQEMTGRSLMDIMLRQLEQ